jgi:hypothetical protein
MPAVCWKIHPPNIAHKYNSTGEIAHKYNSTGEIVIDLGYFNFQ